MTNSNLRRRIRLSLAALALAGAGVAAVAVPNSAQAAVDGFRDNYYCYQNANGNPVRWHLAEPGWTNSRIFYTKIRERWNGSYYVQESVNGQGSVARSSSNAPAAVCRAITGWGYGN